MSQISGHADNHKTEEGFIPTSCWGNVDCVEASSIEKRLLEIEKEIAPCKPRIIGVTKYFGLSAIVNGYKAGLRDFGESRALDAIEKIKSLPEEIRENSRFHFIGHLQTNKVEKVVKYFDYIQSVDSLKLARVISDVACRLNKREKILLQVNVAGEKQKFGYEKEQLNSEIVQIKELPNLEVEGLMCMAPFGASEAELSEIFSELRKFKDDMFLRFGLKLNELSMGMSEDYKIAVQEGATMIRVGRKLFN